MKKILIPTALMLVIAFTVGTASAQMVDIGTGKMDAAEFAALKAVVEGRQTTTEMSVTSPGKTVEQYGPMVMEPAEFEALRNQIGSQIDHGQVAKVEMVDIGTGEMPLDEFIALKRIIQQNKGRIFPDLASVQP